MMNPLILSVRPPSPQPSPARGEGANVGLRPPKPIDDAGEDVLMMICTGIWTSPLSPTLPREGGGGDRALRAPTAIHAGKTF
jgi:hypothetical protein